MQLCLPLELSARRPLIPLEAAMVILDKEEDEVLSLMETGQLCWAWDIRGAQAERREIRIWQKCLLAYLGDKVSLPALAQLNELSVIMELFPRPGEQFKGTELKRMFCCGHQHVLNLIGEGLLTATTKASTGPNGSPLVTRQSIIHLFRTRRVL
jgi:hypothetical protein